MEEPLTHRVWKIGSISLMFIMSLQLTFTGFYATREKLYDHSVLTQEHAQPGRKLIFLIFDALREDFNEWPAYVKLHEIDHPYAGQKISLFKELAEKEPENTLFLPLVSEIPTLTAVRCKSFLSGVLTMALEFTEALAKGKFTEDHLLYQLNQKLDNKAKTAFYGDELWNKLFGDFWTRFVDWPCLDLLDLDTVDNGVFENAMKEIDNGSDFDFLLLHFIGVDSSGHSYSSYHPELTRKLLDTERDIAKLIEKMDDDTTLVVFGDHGMTVSGSHGADSENEMRTTLFAYQKTPMAFG